MTFNTIKGQIIYGINSMMEKTNCYTLDWFDDNQPLRFTTPNGELHDIVLIDMSKPKRGVLLISSKPTNSTDDKCLTKYYTANDFNRLKDLENIFTAVFHKLNAVGNPIAMIREYVKEYETLYGEKND
jgi:hypothetical protein